MLAINGRDRTPIILTRMPRMEAMPTAAELDERIDALLVAEWADAEMIGDGADWYSGHAPCAMWEIAEDIGLSIRTVAGMLAAMSAGYSWPDSLRHIYLLAARPEGSRASKDNPVPGIAAPYGWTAIAQAEAIRDGADPDLVLRNSKGDTETVKRWNFFHALNGDLSRVTIDVHMARGLTGGFIDSTPSSRKQYSHLADAVRRASDRHGVEPAAMQAILWTIIRGEAH